MPARIKKLLLNLFVLFITLCLMTIAGEILVRAFSIVPKEENWVGADKRWYEYDSLLGWRKIPNTKTTRISIKGQNSVFFQVNSKGFRGPEYPYKKPDLEYRVLFLGDSFTEGYMVEMKDLFSEVMKNKLNSMKKHKHFEALNSGTAGYSTDQELLFYENEGKKYNSDLTILMFYQNDLNYNNEPKDWSMYYKPLFKIINGKLVLTNVPVPKPDKIVKYDQLTTKEESMLKRIRVWLDINSHLYRLIKERIKNTHYLYNMAIKLHLMEKPGNDFELLPRNYNVWERAYNKSVQDSWIITEAMIKQLKEDTAVVGSRLLVFFVPDEASIHNDVWLKFKKQYGFTEETYNVDQPGIVLEDVCKRNGIDFMNPTRLLKEKAAKLEKEGKRLYDPVDHHWNVHGYRFVGEILAAYVDARYLSDNDSK